MRMYAQFFPNRSEIETLVIDNKKLVQLVEEMDGDLRDADERMASQATVLNLINSTLGDVNPAQLKDQLKDMQDKANAADDLERHNEDLAH